MSEKMTDEEIDKLLERLDARSIEQRAAQAIRQLRQAEQDAWYDGFHEGLAQRESA